MTPIRPTGNHRRQPGQVVQRPLVNIRRAANALRSRALHDECMPQPADTHRRILVPISPQSTAAAAPRVRRYKMARMASVSRADPTIDRFAHLRRSYD